MAAGHGEARRQALHVPFERAGERLVEVVHVEDEPALRSAEQAEVRQVRVTAQLHGDAGVRRGGEVGGHQQSRPPVERERRGRHPLVPQRNDVEIPRGGLPLEQRDRVGAVRSRTPRALV